MQSRFQNLSRTEKILYLSSASVLILLLLWLTWHCLTTASPIPDYSKGKLPLTFATRNHELQKELIKIHEEGGLPLQNDNHEPVFITVTPTMSILLTKSESKEFNEIKEKITNMGLPEGLSSLSLGGFDRLLTNIKYKKPEMFHDFLKSHSEFFKLEIPTDENKTSILTKVPRPSSSSLDELLQLYINKFTDDVASGDWNGARSALAILVEFRVCEDDFSDRSFYTLDRFYGLPEPLNPIIIDALIECNESLLKDAQENIRGRLFSKRIDALKSLERIREERASTIESLKSLLDCIQWNDLVLLNITQIKNSLAYEWKKFSYDVDKDSISALKKVYRPVIDNCKLQYYEIAKLKDWPEKLAIPESCFIAKDHQCYTCNIHSAPLPFRDIMILKMRRMALKIYKGDELSKEEMMDPFTGEYYKVSARFDEIRIDADAFFFTLPLPKDNPEFIEKIRSRIDRLNKQYK